MNAQQLYLENGESAGIYFCGKCRKVSANQRVSEECCAVLVCVNCHAHPRERYYSVCAECVTVERDRREQEKFEKSEKLETWDGPVYLDDAGSNEGYFDSLEELYDWIACEGFIQENCPAYCWAAIEKPFVEVDAGSAIENGTSDAYEDWESDTLVGVPEFEAACEAFNAANAHHTHYAVDYTKSIAIKYDKS